MSGSVAFSQNYVIGQSTGTSAPYAYNYSPSSPVLGITSQDVLSSTQTIPFSFSFYGSSHTSYKASDNGYITFDVASSTSTAANTSIPNAGGPNNAIYAFWDDLGVVSGSGSADEVFSYTYGDAPNRTHVIQWFSVTPASGSGFVYVAIRLHECGTFDVVHNYANATGMSGTVGCENAAGSVGVQVSGSPNLTFPSVGSGESDDIVYTFYDTGINYDIAVNSCDLNQYVTLGNNTVSGSLTNNGGLTVTSFDLNYSVNGGTTVTDNITGVNIATGASYNYSHSTPWNVATGGQTYELKVWATNINGNADLVACNDTVTKSLFSNNGTGSPKKVLIEEFTGAWCGYCPDGLTVLEGIKSSHGDDVVIVSIHDGDAMEFSDGIRSGFSVTAYPGGMVDRVLFSGEPKEPHSRGAWDSNTTSQLSIYTPLSVKLNLNYDTTTRVIDATAIANFSDYASGDLRFVFMVVEDSVTGTGSGYNQTNYYNTTAGSPWQGAGNPIVGYVHKDVLRNLPSGAYGNSGVIPTTVSPGDSATESFQYTLPAGYDASKVKIVAFVANYASGVGNKYVYNVTEEHLPMPGVVGIAEDNTLFNDVQVYPNPFSSTATIKVDLKESTELDVAVYNVLGKKVMNVSNNFYNAGTHAIQLDRSNLSSGVYFVKVNSTKGAKTLKVIVE